MPKYTDDQINEAIQKAAAKNTPGPVYAWELSMYKKVIDALPEPQDDWQECTADDLQYGDIYRAESSDANIAYKQPITKCTIVGDWVDVQHEGGMKSSARIASNTFYRIPATIVQHPYPLDHPAIVVIEADGYEDTNPQVFVWTGNRYENDAWCFDADDITSWKTINPAKVVADND